LKVGLDYVTLAGTHWLSFDEMTVLVIRPLVSYTVEFSGPGEVWLTLDRDSRGKSSVTVPDVSGPDSS
jgi:hypothetical protein